jgi:hypothetical protein
MEKFIKIDVKYYVTMGLQTGVLEPVLAYKTSKVLARHGKVGEQVITYTDNGLVEKNDKITNNNDWILMKANDYGYPIIDEFGNVNEWIVKGENFKEEYELDEDIDGVFISKDKIQLFVPVLMDMVFVQNGKDMFVEAGGYLNISNISDIYGISKRDFDDTYLVMNNKSSKKAI